MRSKLVLLSILFLLEANAQTTLRHAELVSASYSFIAPSLLIGYGLFCVNDNGFPSSYNVRNYRNENFSSFKNPADDYLVFAPAALVYGFDFIKIKPKHDMLNQTIIFAKTSLLTLAITQSLKYTTHFTRPDNSDNLSFPSAHTAFAFAYATVLKNEFKNKWYIGAGGYVIATGVGAMRILNNKHWFSDVMVGAGIGILSAEIICTTHQNKWKWKNKTALVPYYFDQSYGLSFVSTIGR